MIDPLGPAERALIAAGRDALGPSAATVARIKVQVAGAIAAGGAGAAASAGVTAVATKLAVVAASAVAIGTGAYLHVRSAEVAPASPSAPRLDLGERDALEAIELSAAPRVAIAEREAPAPIVAPPALPRIAPAPVAAPPPRASLRREIELVDEAMQALQRHDFAAVLATIHLYDAETLGGGQLAEDASAIAVEAMCRSGDPAAADRRTAFAARWPMSSQLPRLAAACP
jgi:hypothetical protein